MHFGGVLVGIQPREEMIVLSGSSNDCVDSITR